MGRDGFYNNLLEVCQKVVENAEGVVVLVQHEEDSTTV